MPPSRPHQREPPEIEPTARRSAAAAPRTGPARARARSPRTGTGSPKASLSSARPACRRSARPRPPPRPCPTKTGSQKIEDQGSRPAVRHRPARGAGRAVSAMPPESGLSAASTTATGPLAARDRGHGFGNRLPGVGQLLEEGVRATPRSHRAAAPPVAASQLRIAIGEHHRPRRRPRPCPNRRSRPKGHRLQRSRRPIIAAASASTSAIGPRSCAHVDRGQDRPGLGDRAPTGRIAPASVRSRPSSTRKRRLALVEMRVGLVAAGRSRPARRWRDRDWRAGRTTRRAARPARSPRAPARSARGRRGSRPSTISAPCSARIDPRRTARPPARRRSPRRSRPNSAGIEGPARSRLGDGAGNVPSHSGRGRGRRARRRSRSACPRRRAPPRPRAHHTAPSKSASVVRSGERAVALVRQHGDGKPRHCRAPGFQNSGRPWRHPRRAMRCRRVA